MVTIGVYMCIVYVRNGRVHLQLYNVCESSNVMCLCDIFISKYSTCIKHMNTCTQCLVLRLLYVCT